MKTALIAILGLGLCVQARCSSLSTTDGATYNNITMQRVDPDGLYIEYTTTGGGIGMSKVKFTRLSSNLQKEYGYDPAKAQQYEAGVAKANDDFRQESIRVAQLENSARQARDAENEKVAEERTIAMIQSQAAQAAGYGYPMGGGAYDWSSLGGGYGAVAIPQVGRMPRDGTTYAPVVRPIPFPQINTPHTQRFNAPR